MSNALYVTSMQARSGKAVVALGLMELLTRQVERVAIFRPVIASGLTPDPLIELLRQRYRLDMGYRDAYAFTYADAAHIEGDGGTPRLIAQIADCFSSFTTSSITCSAWEPTTPGRPLRPSWLSTRSWR